MESINYDPNTWTKQQIYLKIKEYFNAQKEVLNSSYNFYI